ncbi:hypothetical protein BJ878DRAFT_148064 [Calycina marina]|uniref:Uncharacterized protein n=1 Tax=Calycina marina TaxID=1763456 RepID=A0A9P7YZJ3_9HELO|nr:hypothetical protein BJ878DRAFT_148064 [Calycina marina]
MLPPIEDSVLQSNPKFASLHEILKVSILTPNGATKLHPAKRERDAVTEELRSVRSRAAKRHILKSALAGVNLSTPPVSAKKTASPLPAELVELILLLISTLFHPVSPIQHKLLFSTTQFQTISQHLPAISALLSSHLHAQALALVRIQTPTINPSFLHRGIPKLCQNVSAIKKEVVERKAELEKRRGVLVTNTTTLLSIYHLASTLTIRLLEQTLHGSVARHTRSHAELLLLTAKSTVLAVKEKSVRAEKIIYTPEVVAALRNYTEELRDGEERLRGRERDAKRVLWGYGVGREEGGEGKEKVMREIARVYGELMREVREVARDVERLRGKLGV